MATASNEREAFSQRLRQSLQQAQLSPDKPSELARQFNMRFTGRPVSAHAARKWLIGESIPTQDKLRVLAAWLKVPHDWLRFGEETTHGDAPLCRCSGLGVAELSLMADIQRLDAHHRHLLREFVRSMLTVHR